MGKAKIQVGTYFVAYQRRPGRIIHDTYESQIIGIEGDVITFKKDHKLVKEGGADTFTVTREILDTMLTCPNVALKQGYYRPIQ